MVVKESILSRDNSLILRGVAIVFIILHNFLHTSAFGFSPENEMFFTADNAQLFFSALGQGKNVVWEFISHLGWIGVPVFIFLTGYGISIKGPMMRTEDSFFFIKRNHIKLLVLMLPAILFFMVIDIVKGDIWPGLLKRFSYLTMMVNFAYPYLNCKPGVYWYFGLTFQLYLLWAVLGRRMNVKNLLSWSVVFTIALFLLCISGLNDSLSIYRHCFTGWFPVFAIGVFMGSNNKGDSLKSDATTVWMEVLLWFVLLFAIIFMSRWLVSWIFVPIVSLGWFLVFGMVLLRSCYISGVFRWIGKYSAFIFVCHPIARMIVLNTFYHHYSNVIANVLLYLFSVIVISLVYHKIHHWLLNKIMPERV